MAEEKLITGKTEEEVWQQLKKDISAKDIFEYSAVIKQGKNEIFLAIDIDPGGGFEGGYATTTFRSKLNNQNEFRFAIHKEGLLDEIGKFFGMQDVKIGVKEFDKKFIIKTNNERGVKKVFSDRSAREVFKKLNNFTFGITSHHAADSEEKLPYLELIIEEGITDVKVLQKIYHAFLTTLLLVESV